MATPSTSAPFEPPLPTALVIGNHGPLVSVLCPFCRGTHFHLWRLGHELRPVRPAHCPPFRPYTLLAADPTESPQPGGFK